MYICIYIYNTYTNWKSWGRQCELPDAARSCPPDPEQLWVPLRRVFCVGVSENLRECQDVLRMPSGCPQDVLREFPEPRPSESREWDSALSRGCLRYVFNDQELVFSKVQNLHDDIARAHHWQTRTQNRNLIQDEKSIDLKVILDQPARIAQVPKLQWMKTLQTCPKHPLKPFDAWQNLFSGRSAMPLHREIRWVRIPVVSWFIIDIMMYFIIFGALVLPWIPMQYHAPCG